MVLGPLAVGSPPSRCRLQHQTLSAEQVLGLQTRYTACLQGCTEDRFSWGARGCWDMREAVALCKEMLDPKLVCNVCVLCP